VEPTSGPRLGRLANHADSKKELNSKMTVFRCCDKPTLCLFAIRDIAGGEEIRYDYGVQVPWKKVNNS
jgi:SET domain-containing protein